MIYKRGDTHGEFAGVAAFCQWKETSRDDIMIILGDAGINGMNPARDKKLKDYLSALPITLFCIHGNHDRRSAAIPGYKEVTWMGGICYWAKDCPNLYFAKDGEIYDLEGQRTLVIGGAASADKKYRLEKGLPWWEDEEPSKEIKRYVEMQLDQCGWQVDQVLTHTMPLSYLPENCLAAALDAGLQTLETEKWLDRIERKLKYSMWSAGHWHVDLQVSEHMQILYRNYKNVGSRANCVSNVTPEMLRHGSDLQR